MNSSSMPWGVLAAFLSHGGIKLFIIALAIFAKYRSWSKDNEQKRKREEAKLKTVQTSFEMGPAPVKLSQPAPVPSAPPVRPVPPPSGGGLSGGPSPWSNADPFDGEKKGRR